MYTGWRLASGRSRRGGRSTWGLGTRLIETAELKSQGCARLISGLAVISSIGTREYYRARGFRDGALYQFRDLEASAAQETASPLE